MAKRQKHALSELLQLMALMKVQYVVWSNDQLPGIQNFTYQDFYQLYKAMETKSQRCEFSAHVSVASRYGKIAEHVSQASWVAHCHVAWGYEMCPDSDWQNWIELVDNQ